MSTRTGATIRRVSPAGSAWEANERWALNGKLRRQQPTFTAEDHEQDLGPKVRIGRQAEAVIAPPASIGCPRSRPERDCGGGPDY